MPAPCASTSSAPSPWRPYVTNTREPIVWMPKGAKPAGSFGSTKAPGAVTRFHPPSKTSTRALWKSVAYSRGPDGRTGRATAPRADRPGLAGEDERRRAERCWADRRAHLELARDSGEDGAG